MTPAAFPDTANTALSFAPVTRADVIADVVAVTVSVSLIAAAILIFVWLFFGRRG